MKGVGSIDSNCHCDLVVFCVAIWDRIYIKYVVKDDLVSDLFICDCDGAVRCILAVGR